MKRGSNTWEWFEKVAKDLGTTPEKIAKDQFKGQWFTPFKSYAKVFANPEDLTAKMRTVELTPKEIERAKRYVDKVNKTDIISMRKKLGLKDSKGKRHIFISNSLKTLIKGLERQIFKEGTNIPSKEEGYDHINDSLGYMLDYIKPLTINTINSIPQRWNIKEGKHGIHKRRGTRYS